MVFELVLSEQSKTCDETDLSDYNLTHETAVYILDRKAL